MKREKRKTADASKDTPSTENHGFAGEHPLSTQHSALSTPSSVLCPESSVLDVFCPKCSYNLRGIDSARCPECGYSLAFLKIAESRIPWVHRKEIGRFRAYWRTVWWATFRRLKFGEELARPMSLPDARRFHYVTMCHVYMAILVLTGLLVFEGPRSRRAAFDDHTALSVCVILVMHLCVLLAFGTACRIGGDTIRSKNMPAARQAQTIGLGYYAAGAFAWLPLTWPVMFFGFEQMIIYERVWYVATACAILGGVSFVLPGLLWLYDVSYLERCVHHRSSAEQAKAGWKQMLLLGMVEFVILIVLPLAIAYVALIFYSLA
ncbi:MAG: hypothetical protein IID34_06935 [Planctomycetes bacterium]|nr:hypothetical protein [Planctomycetota bacterium]